MKHLLLHAAPVNDTISKIQCIYCLEHCTDESDLEKHLLLVHPLETKNSVTNTFNCIICEVSLLNNGCNSYFFVRFWFFIIGSGFKSDDVLI